MLLNDTYANHIMKLDELEAELKGVADSIAVLERHKASIEEKRRKEIERMSKLIADDKEQQRRKDKEWFERYGHLSWKDVPAILKKG